MINRLSAGKRIETNNKIKVYRCKNEPQQMQNDDNSPHQSLGLES